MSDHFHVDPTPSPSNPPSHQAPSHNTPSQPSQPSGSSAPSAPAVDPVVAEKESLFQQIYIQLWGEPATKAYLEAAAKSGLNTWEFQRREMDKPLWGDTKTYNDKASSIADLIASLGIGRQSHRGKKDKG